eukprot:gene35267-58189_t
MADHAFVFAGYQQGRASAGSGYLGVGKLGAGGGVDDDHIKLLAGDAQQGAKGGA